MVTLTINGNIVRVPEGTTIMQAAENNGFSIPHLCYEEGVSEIGACRLCCVEVEGEQKLIPSCITKAEEGMVVTTNSQRVREAVKTNLIFIMSQHNGRCTQCVRSGNCRLQSLCSDFELDTEGYFEDIPTGKQIEWPQNFPMIRDATRCIKCMRCIQVCDHIQNMSVWDLVGTGAWARVDVSEGRQIEESDCALCGQCIVHCPTGALKERSDVAAVASLVRDPDVITVAQIAPAIRTAWGEGVGLAPEQATVNRLAGIMKQIGFDYVFDTSFTADLTIMEEGNEFLKRKTEGDLDELPMFTSCCPGWIRFVKARYPQLRGRLSTAKSPQQMFGAVIKSYFAQKIGADPEKIRVVSVMPCVAKKAEADLPAMKNSGVANVDYVLTTREVVRMIKANNIEAEYVPEVPFDRIMSDYTGAGVIFGVTGGVMEAALRSAYYFITGEKPDPEAFVPIRSGKKDAKPWKEQEIDINGINVRVAVVSGLKNADLLCRQILRGQVKYDFVEVMACPNGCSGGGGQPQHQDDVDRRYSRGEILHGLDEKMPLRYSHENPDVQKLYEDYLGSPLSELSEELLHTDHFFEG